MYQDVSIEMYNYLPIFSLIVCLSYCHFDCSQAMENPGCVMAANTDTLAGTLEASERIMGDLQFLNKFGKSKDCTYYVHLDAQLVHTSGCT